jgi:CRP-like cAMP-binding protein
MAIKLDDYVLVAGGFALALSSLPQGSRALRGALLLIGLCGAAWGIEHQRWWVTAAGGALAIANLLQLVLTVPAARRAPMSEEELAFAEGSLSSLPRGAVRQLFDQGLWISGRVGEQLIHEGEPASHLFYLSSGEVSISTGGRELAVSGAGHFFGEITVMNREAASASVTLRTDARFWCIASDTLKRFLAVNPEFRHALEAAFAGDLRDKLRLANQRIVAMGEVA